ncbi:hypothetical protein GOP47_0015867 [Adiantum capillus-veneris]|uniref:Lipoxygenase n=1 Tax=Adiantum capillus-veneris TaxID=13818 RepID=A0A9D4ZED5_ADICA|nr:hypothetical protein GOP47_0015867 [Adiantum capillus-veneris]
MARMVMIKATVRTLGKGFLASSQDAFCEMLGNTASLTLVSPDLNEGTQQPKLSNKCELLLWGAEPNGVDACSTVIFYVESSFGKPGAILLDSHYANEFYLKSITLELPYEAASPLYFPCYSWICPTRLAHCGQPRILFSNQMYLPNETPTALLQLREDDLLAIRGDGKGKRVHGERIYDYDVYNELGNPEENQDLTRPVLGGSAMYPYPRRCRTGRNRIKTDIELEEPELAFDKVYVPRDERFSDLKKNLFMNAGVRSFCTYFLVCAKGRLLYRDQSFACIEQIHRLFADNNCHVSGSKKPSRPISKFPKPGVLEVNKDVWITDKEFGRQCLAGKHPVAIQRLQVFPPSSKLDTHIYGESISSITAHDLTPSLQGLSIKEAMNQNLLYILDLHDSFLPFINRINEQEGKLYASRTILYLTKEKVLLPVAIELTLPPKVNGEKAHSRVFTPDPSFCHPCLWMLAKNHVAIADCGYHQLVSHWLRSHACVEPIIIATRRQLSTMHPLHALLSPHFKDTLHINAMSKTSLINAGGKVEKHYSAGRYCMEITSVAYKSWRLDEESLPKDLIKRGMAVEDKSAKHGVRLLVEDYPYAVDGLELWAAIRQWVKDYLILYYGDDQALQKDSEVSNWWNEIREVGHADHARADWWVSMKTLDELVEVVTTLIWVVSAYHAAMNFGQYAYGAYTPNSPCMSTCLIPEEGTARYAEMLSNPEKFLLEMVPPQGATALTIAVLELLAQHLDEEEYLGERVDPRWNCDARVLAALDDFRENLAKVEAGIHARNASSHLPHRRGEAGGLPYTLLVPSSSTAGLTFCGVPNSISM